MAFHIEQGLTIKRSNWLDVLRGLAIFGVVTVHSMQQTDSIVLFNKSDFFSSIMSLGKYGVELFFFLSGWLLVSIYGLNGISVGKAYWVRRASRIYPLWIIFLFISYLRLKFNSSSDVTSPLVASNGQSQFLHSQTGIVLLSLTFTLFVSASLWNSVIPGGWSIQAEIAHYILFPLIRNRSINSMLNIFASINFMTALLFLARNRIEDLVPNSFLRIIDAWIRLSLYSTISFFLFGILGFTVFNLFKESGIKNLKFSYYNISHNTFIIFCVSVLVIPNPFGGQIEAVGYLFLMILISFGILRNKKLSAFFQFLGKHAYFIYFMHFIALASVNWLSNRVTFASLQMGSQQLVFILILFYSLAVSVLFAIPSMKFIEAPIIRIAHRIK